MPAPSSLTRRRPKPRRAGPAVRRSRKTAKQTAPQDAASAALVAEFAAALGHAPPRKFNAGSSPSKRSRSLMAALDTAGRRSFIDMMPGLLIEQPHPTTRQRFDAAAAGEKAHRQHFASRTKSAGAWMFSLLASIAMVTAAAAVLMMNAPVPHQHLLDIAELTRR